MSNTVTTSSSAGRNRLTARFLADLDDVWAEHGKTALVQCAREEPGQFCRLVAGLLPREATLDVSVGVDVMDFAAKFRHAVALLDGADPEQATPRLSYRTPRMINGR